MSKNNVKFIIIFGIILFIYVVAMIIIFNKNTSENPQNPNPNNPIIDKPNIENPNNYEDPNQEENEIVDGIFLLENKGIITKTTSKWKIGNVDNVLNKKFNVYSSNELLGNFTILYNNGFNIYDDNNNEINIEENLFAINTVKHFNRYNLNYEEITEEDKESIKRFLDSKGITYNIEKLLIEKNISDYNKDGIRENLFTVSFINGLEDTENYQEFSIAFINYQKENTIIYSNLNESLCAVSLKQYFDFDSDKYILMTCNYPSEQGYNVMLYKLNGLFSSEELNVKIDY